ncbi:MAG: nucleotidyltransferase family protein [Nanoarchaeota archaeon]|nr:nucleotidyltransferase family protein [Nanoarchaeota archaeon]
MKAIILAAGYATRLYPLTQNQPKPLLEVQGKPIVTHLLDKIKDMTLIDHIYIVTNDKFHQHFETWKNTFKYDTPITIVNDKTTSNEDRLGSLGDVNFVLEQENIDEDIMVVAGDNLFQFSLADLEQFYQEKKKSVVALYDVKDQELAKLYGIVAVDENNKMIEFEEKPPQPKSTLASTGIYLYTKEATKELKEFVNQFPNTDKAGNFLEHLHKKEDVFCFTTDKQWIDIGNKEQLELAQQNFKP